MILSKIINAVGAVKVLGRADLAVGSIAFDSRKVQPGSLFVAIPGYKTDGFSYIGAAIKSGATSILSEKEIEVPAGVTLVLVSDARAALAGAAAEFFDNPSGKLRVIGVTGTSGKTTTTYLLRSILKRNGEKTGLLGTINYDLAGEILESKNTTPESLTLQELLYKMVMKKLDACVMEVSSHSLALGRVAGVDFAAGVFLNLTQDHMDFHKNFEEYLGAKLKLFEMIKNDGVKRVPKVCAVNLDDEYAGYFTKKSKVKTLTFGLKENADIRAVDIKNEAGGLSFGLSYLGKVYGLSLKLKGAYNAYNAMAAAAVGLGLNLDWQIIKEGLEAVENVPGRFETYRSSTGFTVVVDYAHKPDALKKLLTAVREMGPRRIISVFGCGGDKDRAKRPMMGGISGELADHTIVTSDNPRSEEPLAIIKEIISGIKSGTYSVSPDRKTAICEAIGMAKEGDFVVVAGKGHEDYQIIGDKVSHFSDKEIIIEALKTGGVWKE